MLTQAGENPDREAVRRLKGGDLSGLESLVRRYQTRALRAAFLVTRDLPLAEDVVQDAFLEVYARIGSFDSDRPFGPWFLRLIVNRALKAASRQKDRALAANTPADPEGDPAARLEQAETVFAVREALGSLTPRQRAGIVLRYYLGLTEAEIADRLGCSRGTVKRRLHEARLRLKARLGPILRGESHV